MPANKKNVSNCNFISFEQTVSLVEFSPYEWCRHLLLVITSDDIKVLVVNTEESEDGMKFESDGHEVDPEILCTLQQPVKSSCVSISPDTTLYGAEKSLRFAVGCVDNKVRVYSTDLQDSSDVEALVGHTSTINAVSYSPDANVPALASVADDCTCRLWGVATSGSWGPDCLFVLKSPGTAVAWHPLDPGKLLVGERCGSIRLFNTETREAIHSVTCGASPLISADWSLGDPLRLAGVTPSSLLSFLTHTASLPEMTVEVCEGGGAESMTSVRLSRHNDRLAAVCSRKYFKVVGVHNGKVEDEARLTAVHGVSWHASQPILAVAAGTRVLLKRVATRGGS